MLWRTEGMGLENMLPVPKKQPGRHFSAGYHMLGHVASSYDVKYAHMTYGDHYRKKIEEEIERERNRIEDVMMEPKRQAIEKKRAMKTAKKTTKRYDLNELRHHQRRCAALLFGARQQGSHEIPYMVRWAPRRRESYYLMSERVYNDRLLMKLREEEEKRRMLASPINFDFADNIGDTKHLYDFQKLINKTSRVIKGLSFDTEYKEYDYDFNEEEKKKLEEQQRRVSLSPSKDGEENAIGQQASKQSRVQFSDVTDHESDGQGGRLSRERRRARRAAKESGGLDMSDIELGLSPDSQRGDEDDLSMDDLGEEEKNLRDLLSKMSLQGASKRSSRDTNTMGSRRTRNTDSYRSNFDDGTDGYSLNDGLSFTDKSLLDDGEDEELEDGVSELGGAHNNKYCKHSPGTTSMKKRAQDYYKKLPRLLRTSELRDKASKLKEKNRFQPTGPHVNHECMAPHKTAYERALALVRGRSLPSDYNDLFNKTTGITYSYMPGMPGTETSVLKEKLDELPTGPSGLKGILGEVDMNDFYREEDELIYYIKPDELRTSVVGSSVNGKQSNDDSDDDSDDSSDDDDGNTSATLKSSLDPDTESSNF